MKTRSECVGRALGSVLLLLALLACAPSASTGPVSAPDSGVDLRDLDPSVPPVQDLYQYANGGWLQRHPVPSNANAVTRIGEEQHGVTEILQNLAALPHLEGEEKMLADFFRSGMDVETIERLRLDPLGNLLAAIDSVADSRTLQLAVAKLHRLGFRPYFRLGLTPSLDGSGVMMVELHQAELGLGSPGLYLDPLAAARSQREAYQDHLRRVLTLSGWSEAAAERGARGAMAVETRLARACLRPAELRDPRLTYHPQSPGQLARRAPHWNWLEYFRSFGLDVTEVNVTSLDYLGALDQEWGLRDPLSQKAYLRLVVLREMTDALPLAFADERRAFRAGVAGTAETPPGRLALVTAMVNRKMGMALGRLYVRKYVSRESRQKADRLVASVKAQLALELRQARGLTADRRKDALAKLEAMTLQLWFPEPWPSTEDIVIRPQSYAANVMAANELLLHQELARVGKVDQRPWPFPPQTANAQYSASSNTLTLGSGLLGPPFFSPGYDEAVAYGRLGVLVAHELMHAFDDVGAEFDALGRLRPHPSKDPEAVAEALLGRELPELARLVRGECMADRVGLLVAYRAFKAEDPQADLAAEQRFFLGYAQLWAANARPGYQAWQSQRDPHPAPRERVNGAVAGLEEFRRAFAEPTETRR